MTNINTYRRINVNVISIFFFFLIYSFITSMQNKFICKMDNEELKKIKIVRILNVNTETITIQTRNKDNRIYRLFFFFFCGI